MMNKRFMSKIGLAGVLVFAVFQFVALAEPSEANKKREAKANRDNRDNRQESKGRRPDMERKPVFADMSAEDREALKQALQAVWENPEVMQARDEVKRATETFRMAIRKAVGKENPRVATLVEKMHGGGKSREWDKKRPGPPEGRGGRSQNGRPGPAGANERGPGLAGEGRGIGSAGFMAFPGDFSKEEKKRLESARQKAMESEAFQQVQKNLRGLLKQGEVLRKKRVEMFQQTRVAMTQAMIEADPEVKPLLERMEKSKRGRQE